MLTGRYVRFCPHCRKDQGHSDQVRLELGSDLPSLFESAATLWKQHPAPVAALETWVKTVRIVD